MLPCPILLSPSRLLIPPFPSFLSNYQLWLGRHNLFDDEDTAQFVHVSESFPHPCFNMSLLKNHTRQADEDYSHDLMLLRLTQPAEITEAVQVVELPTQEPEVGTTCLASGWGSIEPENCMWGQAVQPKAGMGTPASEGERAREAGEVRLQPFFSRVRSLISR